MTKGVKITFAIIVLLLLVGGIAYATTKPKPKEDIKSTPNKEPVVTHIVKDNIVSPVNSNLNTVSNIGKGVFSKYGGTYMYRISDDTIYRTLSTDEKGFIVMYEDKDKVSNGVNYIWKSTAIYFK